MSGLTRLLRPGGAISMLVSSTVRDRGAGVAPIGEQSLRDLAGPYAAWGLWITKLRPATAGDVAAARSAWGRRLGAGGQRPAWRVQASFDQPHRRGDSLDALTNGARPGWSR